MSATLGNQTGGGGGRILPGTGGASVTGGSYTGGGGGSNSQLGIDGSTTNSGTSGSGGGGGGGWGARGGSAVSRTVTFTNYGTGGKAVDLNGYTITWQGNFSTNFSNSVYGSVA